MDGRARVMLCMCEKTHVNEHVTESIRQTAIQKMEICSRGKWKAYLAAILFQDVLLTSQPGTSKTTTLICSAEVTEVC